MKITPPTTSVYVKELIKGMKNNEAAGTDCGGSMIISDHCIYL
jgi:hypothetical protein